MELLNEVLKAVIQKDKESLILALNAFDNNRIFEAERHLGGSYAYSEVMKIIQQKIKSNQLDENKKEGK